MQSLWNHTWQINGIEQSLEHFQNLLISQVDVILDEVEATPIGQLDRPAVRTIVRKHAITQAGREPGESGQT